MDNYLEDIKDKAGPLFKKEGVIRSSVFGSAARGEATDTSDIDMLVELPEGKTLLDLVGLRQDLEKVLQKKVDLLTYRSIHPRLKDRIFREQIKIYG